MIGEAFEDVAEIASTRGGVGSDKLIIGAADLFVKRQIGCAAQTAALGVLMKNAAEEEGIIPDVRAKEKRLFRSRLGERDEHIGNVLTARVGYQVRRAQSACAGKRFQERRHVITQLAIGNAGVAENMARQDIKIKVG